MALSVLLASLTAPTLQAQQHPPYNPFARDELRQQKYVLFVFCTGIDDKRLAKQMSLLKKDWNKLKARGVLVLDEYEVSLLPEVQEDLRHYQVKNGDFKAVLVSRNVKTLYTSHQPIQADKLSQVLDAQVASKRPRSKSSPKRR